MKEVKQSVQYLTTEELAERLRRHPATIRRWRVEGEGPRYIKPGSKVLYSILEVEQFERASTKKSTAG